VYLDFGLIINAILLALGIYWCYEVFGRWHSDLEEVREIDDNLRKGVIIAIWAVTLVIAVLVINFALGVGADIVSGIRSLL
jgi:hypothetical protein